MQLLADSENQVAALRFWNSFDLFAEQASLVYKYATSALSVWDLNSSPGTVYPRSACSNLLHRIPAVLKAWSPGSLQEAARHTRLPSLDSGDAAWVSKDCLAGWGPLGDTLLLLNKGVSPMPLSWRITSTTEEPPVSLIVWAMATGPPQGSPTRRDEPCSQQWQ